ncbi:hypothetical protein [Brevundimonas subvibrioides]|uniref:hypothetical protein n=1 Tax=Brevundimonas subvibrioides TaxID=74313 RepID=UPI0022B2F75B|nr:hypothetical protein [Brevundimonas subvibrioides]
MVDASLSFARRRPTFGPVQRRRAALLAASVLFHIAILTPLALRFFEKPLAPRDLVDDSPIFLQMEPRPLLPGEVARIPASASARTEPTPTLGDVTAERSSAPAAPGQSGARPSPLSPRIAAEAPADAPPTTVDPWQVTPETMRAAVARSIRLGAAGCRAMDGRLSASEQQLCDDRFNAAAGRAGPLGPRTLNASEARREAQFARDGAAALARYDSLRGGRPGVGIVGASPECVGGNLRGTCAGALLPPHFQHEEDAPFGGTAGPK